jgi:type I restriction enzyme S subunit
MGRYIDNPAYPSLRLSKIRELLIPLPPLEEQRRIVARVEELMSRIREAKRLRQEAKEEAERLWQSILSETFPKPGTELPEGWRWVRLGEVCDYKSGVWGQTDPNGIPVLRSTDFLPDGNLSYETAIRLALSEKQLKKAVLQPGDILLERSGGGPNKPVGRVAYFQGQGTYCCGNFITRLHVSCADVVPKFLFYYLFYFHISGGTESLQTQTTNIRNLRFDEYLAITVPLPPLEEQRRIVAYLQDVQEKIRALKEVQAQTETELKRLEQAILDKAFRGEL